MAHLKYVMFCEEIRVMLVGFIWPKSGDLFSLRSGTPWQCVKLWSVGKNFFLTHYENELRKKCENPLYINYITYSCLHRKNILKFMGLWNLLDHLQRIIILKSCSVVVLRFEDCFYDNCHSFYWIRRQQDQGFCMVVWNLVK